MKKILFLGLFCSFSSYAMVESKPTYSVHAGVSSVMGGELESLAETAFSFGFEGIHQKGWLIGFDLIPEVIDYSAGVDWAKGSVSASVANLYAGKAFANGLSVNAGVALTYTEARLSLLGHSDSDSEMEIGFTAGVNYTFTNRFYLGAQWSQLKVDQWSSNLIGMRLGYRF